MIHNIIVWIKFVIFCIVDLTTSNFRYLNSKKFKQWSIRHCHVTNSVTLSDRIGKVVA